MKRRLIIIGCLSALLVGCATQQAAIDQHKIREALLELYTDQIIDNLIRAEKGLPIIQLDYTQAQGMVTMTQSGNISDANAAAHSSSMAIPALTRNVMHSVTNTLMASLGFMRTNQITMAASPVTNSNEVYDAYIEFLTLPGSLVWTSDPPGPCDAVVWKQCDGLYYWVPTQYRGDFFNLALRTTAQRGKPLLAPPDFFNVNVVAIVDEEDLHADPLYANVTLCLDQSIPFDDGTLEFSSPPSSDDTKTDSDKTGQLELPPPTGMPPVKQSEQKKQLLHGKYPIGPNWSTTQKVTPFLSKEIQITISKEELLVLAKLIEDSGGHGVPAKIQLEHRRPPSPTTEDLLERANFQLQQLNQNVVRTGGTGL